MSLIALLNYAKNYFHQARTQRSLNHLNDHYLNDLGFYRDHGKIRPLSPKNTNLGRDLNQSPPAEPVNPR